MNTAKIRVHERDLLGMVEKIREKRHNRSVIGVHTETGWDGPPEITSTAGPVQVRHATTLLAFRAALTEVTEDTPWVCILTPLNNEELPADVRAHLGPYYNLVTLDSAEALRLTFGATSQHPGVVPDRADIPQLLVYLDDAAAHAGGSVAAAPAGVLTADHLYSQIVSLGLSRDLAQNPSVEELVRWSLSPESVAQWERFTTDLPEPVRKGTMGWLRRAIGPNCGAALTFLQAKGPQELLLYGLISEILVPHHYSDEKIRYAATVRFELLTGTGTGVPEGALTEWSDAAVKVADDRDEKRAQLIASTVRQVEEEILSDRFGAAGILHRSSVCAGAFHRRLDLLSASLAGAIGESIPGALPLYDALDYARSHHDARDVDRNRDLRGAEAAVRLLQWMDTADADEALARKSLPEWLSFYRTDLSWVDTCVNAAWSRSGHESLSARTTGVAALALERRRSVDRAFAKVAGQIGAHRSAGDSVLLVEDVLDRIVEPLHHERIREDPRDSRDGKSSSRNPVLMVVLDGMSVPASNTVVGSVLTAYRSSNWREVVPADGHLSTALAVYPTVTTKSRSSLISGQLTTGGQSVERDGLNGWYARRHNGTGGSPLLLHKADLDHNSTEITAHVEDTDGHPLVVAVLNTIDDALDKSDPMDRRWSVDDVTHLDVLMQAAARVGRTVVFVSDHGHVVERCESRPAPGEGTAARWLQAPATPVGVEDGEVYVSGERVLTDTGAAVLAVDEDLRYTARKSGYHGGLALAEAAIPVTILTQEPAQLSEKVAHSLPVEVTDSTTRFPGWWKISPDAVGGTGRKSSAETTPPSRRAVGIRTVPARHAEQNAPGLFELGETRETAPNKSTTRPATAHGPLMKLEKNRVFREQVNRYPIPGYPSAEDVANLVRIINTEGSERLTTEQLQKSLGLTAFAVRGTIARLRQILNMDGVEVLILDGTDLVLSPSLLTKQFGLDT